MHAQFKSILVLNIAKTHFLYILHFAFLHVAVEQTKIISSAYLIAASDAFRSFLCFRSFCSFKLRLAQLYKRTDRSDGGAAEPISHMVQDTHMRTSGTRAIAIAAKTRHNRFASAFPLPNCQIGRDIEALAGQRVCCVAMPFGDFSASRVPCLVHRVSSNKFADYVYYVEADSERSHFLPRFLRYAFFRHQFFLPPTHFSPTVFSIQIFIPPPVLYATSFPLLIFRQVFSIQFFCHQFFLNPCFRHLFFGTLLCSQQFL